MSLEEYAGDRNEDENLKEFYQALTNITPLLESSKYLEGGEPGFSDYVLAGFFQFVRTINPSIYTKMIHNSPYPKISEWATRMDGLFNGYLKNRKTL
jgi:glutathione S-transferase